MFQDHGQLCLGVKGKNDCKSQNVRGEKSNKSNNKADLER